MAAVVSRVLPLVWLVFILFSVHTAALPEKRNAASACRKLAAALPGKIFLSGSIPYTNSTNSYFFVQNRLDPACFASPTTADDVSKIIKILVAFPDTKFAVKGGGHSTIIGASNIDDGVTIDLRKMNSIKPLDATWSKVGVGAGATSIEVYRALEPQNRVILAGRVSGVGIGGFMTGGGLSFFSPEHGFACDSVTNIEIVLASGEIVNANANSRADLFRALKGGQNNLGVVTRFDVKTYTQGIFWGGFIRYPSQTDSAQLDAFTAWKSSPQYDPKFAIEQSFLYLGSSGTFLGSTAIYYTKPITSSTPQARFTSITPQISSSTRNATAANFAEEVQRAQPVNQYSIYACTTFAISPTILKKVQGLWKTTTTELSGIANLTSVITFQPLPPPAPASNPNSLGFSPDSTPHKNLVLALINIYWLNDDDTDEVTEAVQNLVAKIEAATKLEGVFREFKYINYAGPFQKPLQSYGLNQFSFLRATARKYDPRGVFQYQAPGGFKLF